MPELYDVLKARGAKRFDDYFTALAARKPSAPPSPLPEGYRQVDYIEGSGTQYILIGSHLWTYWKLELDAVGFTKDGAGQPIMGLIRGDRIECDPLGRYFFIGGSNVVTSNVLTPTRCVFGTNNVDGKTYIDGEEIGSYTHANNASGPVPLFCLWDSWYDSVSHISRARIYGLKFWKVNSTTSLDPEYLELKIDALPCVRESDGEAGLFDLVTETFYGNSGTGDFIVG